MNGLNFPTGRLTEMLNESRRRSSELHGQFLRGRRVSLDGMQQLIELQMNGFISDGTGLERTIPQRRAQTALFDGQQLETFGRGKISQCFGPEFSVYDGRRIPRIPNGDLRMMSRIVSIEGNRRNFHTPAAITAEYDVPTDAWYFREGASVDIPASLWMEIALQPCGFLSAYLDTYALVPHQEYFFRNLDGSLAAANPMDVRGKTIVTRAKLTSSVASSGTVIQKFSFELLCGETVLYTGNATFGYFAVETMINQVGLDAGRRVLPLIHSDVSAAQAASWLDLSRLQQGAAGGHSLRLPVGRMHLIERAAAVQGGGRYGRGYLFASRAVDPDDWFYPFHFYQDPVMPGSLGVEAVLETMQACALAWGLSEGMYRPQFRVLRGESPLTWRYRGQITPQHGLMELEVHLSGIERSGAQTLLTGDASMWVDGLRIYEINHAAIEIAAV